MLVRFTAAALGPVAPHPGRSPTGSRSQSLLVLARGDDRAALLASLARGWPVLARRPRPSWPSGKFTPVIPLLAPLWRVERPVEGAQGGQRGAGARAVAARSCSASGPAALVHGFLDSLAFIADSSTAGRTPASYPITGLSIVARRALPAAPAALVSAASAALLLAAARWARLRRRHPARRAARRRRPGRSPVSPRSAWVGMYHRVCRRRAVCCRAGGAGVGASCAPGKGARPARCRCIGGGVLPAGVAVAVAMAVGGRGAPRAGWPRAPAGHRLPR